ncbi:MAG: DUF2723 domain-containing protein, partial [Gemmatimonadota bacterium]|nr:DUF2723 domain-containing protein [Gemmatimonadota bacterium]
MKGIEGQRVGALPVWGWSLVAGAAVWIVYVVTLGPTTAWWDTSEYIATAQILGIPHPPGNPLFVIIGRAWLVLTAWTGIEVATRINLLAATASAAAASFWFLAVMRVWAHFAQSRTVALVAAFVAVLVGGTAYTVWAQSNVNEKVYTVSLMFVAIITYLAMVWEDHSETWRGDRIFLLVCFLLGLGATNHQMSVLPVLALGVFLVLHSVRTLLRWRLMGAAAVIAILGFSVQLLFVPIRSGQDPVIDEADPECESLLAAITPAVRADGKFLVQCPALAASLARDQYQKPPLGERQAPLGAQVANYFQYFDWQWARALPPGARMFATLLFIGLGLVGLWRHWKGDPDSFWYFATLLATVTIVLVYYLNFRYGYSMNPEIPNEAHEVRERDYFFIVSFNLWGLYVGMGLVTAWESLGRRLSGARGVPLMAGLRTASPVLGIALLPLVFNYPLANRRGDYAARDWAYNMLQSVEPYGILFTNGDNDTFPLWYLQEVEGIRRDVTVIVHSYLGTKWYPKQIRDLTRPCGPGEDPLADPSVVVCQRPFDKDAALDIYAGMGDTPPTRSVHSYTDDEIDGLPLYTQVQAGQAVRFSDRLTVELATSRFLYHPDFLVYRIVAESLGDRPVYFATTAPPVYQAWDLEPHMLRQGLAHKLIDGPIESTEGIVELDIGVPIGWVDRDRSEALLWDVFQVDYLLEKEIWPEPSTRQSIPMQYFLAYL